ncbi:MAG: ROK family protein [Ferroplasma sp.]
MFLRVYDVMYILGFDVGGTKISAVIGKEDGKIIDKIRKRTMKDYGKSGLTDELLALGEELVSRNKIKKISKIGVIFAGPVDAEKGIIISSPNIIGLKNYNISKELEEHFHVPVFLENDATAATIAEKNFGSAKNFSDFVYITLSTGIGGGIFINDKLYKGKHGMAGEVGHMVIMPNGPLCGCGRRGCLEALASGRGITRRVVENIGAVRNSTFFSSMNPGDIDAKKIFEAQQDGDMFAQLMIEETIYYLAVGIVNIINILDPEAIIIGGGLSLEGDILFKPLKLAVEEEMKSMRRPVDIIKGLEDGSDLAAIAITQYKY